MRTLRLAALAISGSVAALTLMGAQRPSALAQAGPGLWEIRGVPGATAPLRQCIADVSVLAQFEHRGRSCSRRVISDSPSSSLVEYNCGAAGFGHSKIDAITPRSFRIDTQGVSGKLPFKYVLQARRVGDCPAAATASRH